MSPVESKSSPAENGGQPQQISPEARVKPGSYQVVAWDLDTTGRRLIDEICQIGGYFHPNNTRLTPPPAPVVEEKPKEEMKEEEKETKDEDKEKKSDGEQDNDNDSGASTSIDATGGSTFSQYVMPHKNPNPGARRSFGIRVVNIGRYRMLKDMATGKILKTKSEISALQEFLDWLATSKGEKEGILLVCHEPTRKVLIPLLLEALYKYNLMDQFAKNVVGFVNATAVVEKFGDKNKITSSSLRSLCKTVLEDTNPNTASASDRSKVLVDILLNLCSGKDSNTIDDKRLTECAVSVQSEEQELRTLKEMLGTQGSLRPIFESQLRQKRSVRERAMGLRKVVAESGLDYKGLSEIYTNNAETKDNIRKVLEDKLNDCDETDMNDLIELFDEHFINQNGNSDSNNAENNGGHENNSYQHRRGGYHNNYRGGYRGGYYNRGGYYKKHYNNAKVNGATKTTNGDAPAGEGKAVAAAAEKKDAAGDATNAAAAEEVKA